MAINIQKHQDAMVKAWKDVLDDKSSTDWALFGYEGQTNDLRLVGTGSGGLEELTEEFNSAKVMYAFLKVSDPQTSLNKYVLINWQGEGAQVVRKGTCVNHIRDVERLLHGAHATINARTEEDIEEARVIKVVSTGSRYDFKGPRSATEQRGPIGSNYQRVIPGKEINSRERDTFWQKEEAEEKARTSADMQRKQAENLRLETERMSREQKELQQREQKIQEREHVINAAHKAELSRAPPPVAQSEKNLEVTPPRVTAEELRRQRTQEAKQLIGQRTIANSKAVFEQHSSASQMHVHKSNPAPVKPVRNSVTQRINAITQQTENSQVEPKQTSPEQHNQVLNNARTELVNNSTTVTTVDKQTIDDHNNKTKDTVNDHKEIINISKTNEVIKSTYQEKLHYDQNDDLDTNDYDVAEQNEEQYSTIKRSPHSKSVESNLVNAGEDVETSKKEVIAEQNHQFVKEDSNQTLVDAYAIYEDMADPGLQARALYDYQAADESEITFDPGDLITHIDCIDEGWWQGLGPDGTFGLFPANYVELIHIQ